MNLISPFSVSYGDFFRVFLNCLFQRFEITVGEGQSQDYE